MTAVLSAVLLTVDSNGLHYRLLIIDIFAGVIMGLQSRLFQGNPALEACLTDDSAHIKEGTVGEHVSKIHSALFALDGLSVLADELRTCRFGRSTAAAVLAFKQKRNIINYAYERRVDNIIGKMTIAALDQEMLRKEQQPPQLPDKSTYGIKFL